MKKEEIDYLYHKVCIPNKSSPIILKSVLKSGLKSHSTIGRSYCLLPEEDGHTPLLPNEHRIWFQTAMKTDFDDLTKPMEHCILIRTQKKYLPKNTELNNDDQFFGEKWKTIFVNDNNFFVIEPTLLEIYQNGEWKKLNNSQYQYRPPKNSMDELSPWIRTDFIKYHLDPDEDLDVQAYADAECFGDTIKDEIEKQIDNGEREENEEEDDEYQ